MLVPYSPLVIFQASPCIRFNKEGTLLAVSTSDNGVKILANTEGFRLLRAVENRPFDNSASASAAIVKVCVLTFSPLVNGFSLCFPDFNFKE